MNFVAQLFFLPAWFPLGVSLGPSTGALGVGVLPKSSPATIHPPFTMGAAIGHPRTPAVVHAERTPNAFHRAVFEWLHSYMFPYMFCYACHGGKCGLLMHSVQRIVSHAAQTTS